MVRLAVGGGSENKFNKGNLQNSFDIIQLVTKPFTYTFYADGGTFSDGGGVKSMERLGINNVSVPATPTRPGYVFTGWKITSTGGKCRLCLKGKYDYVCPLGRIGDTDNLLYRI